MIARPPAEADLRRGEAATWGPRPAMSERRQITLREWRPLRKNTLFGFAVIELPSGLIVRDVGIHSKAGKWWASLPSRPVLDADGRHVSNHAGHKQYAALLGWRNRELADEFGRRIVALVQQHHPEALQAAP
jgi:hypothetical protein